MKTTPFKLLCVTGLFAIFSSTISKSPVLPLFASHLGADPSGVGFVASISAFTGIVASVPAGMLSDRFGRRRMLIISAAVFSTAPFLYLMIGSIWQLAVVRLYHGLATAIFVPVAMALVSDLFHKERGEKMGWFSTSTLLGRFSAPLIGGAILGALYSVNGFNYKVVYMVCCGAGLVVLLLSFRITDPPVSDEKQKTFLSSSPSDRGTSRKWKDATSALRSVLSNRAILTTSIVEAGILFSYGTFETFLPLYSIGAGLGAFKIGVFLSAQVITLALTKPIMGRFSDRHGRKPQILAGAVLGVFCIACFPIFKTFVPLLALSILFGLSLSIVTSATSAFIADISRRETHGSAMGILGSIMDIGHTAGPFISGIIAGYFGFDKAFISAAVVLSATAAIFWASTLATTNKKI